MPTLVEKTMEPKPRKIISVQWLFQPSGYLALAASLLLVALLAWQFSDRDLVLRNGFDPEADRGSPLPVPRHLRLQPAKRGIQLFDGDDRMAGNITATNGPPGVSLYTFDLHAEGTHPAQAKLTGLLWVTNAPGKTVIRRRSDQSGILLRGEYEQPGVKRQTVTLCFPP